MNDDQYFFYPADLKKKTLFIVWTAPNLVIIMAGLVLSTIIFFLTFVWFPLLLTILYLFLTITPSERSVLDGIRDYIDYLFLDQLEYTWGEPEPIFAERKYNVNDEEEVSVQAKAQ